MNWLWTCTVLLGTFVDNLVIDAQFGTIQSEWCNKNLQQCAIKICISRGLGKCDTEISVNYNQIAPDLCNLCKKTCVKAKRGNGEEETRLPCSNNLDCLFGQKCREGGCMNYRQGKQCTRDSQCDRLYTCQDAECKLKPLPNLPSPYVPKILSTKCRPSMGCIYSTECGRGNRCSEGRCIPSENQEDCYLPYKQVKRCNSRRDCDEHYICKRNECVLPRYQELPIPCGSTPDCKTGYKCIGFECVPIKKEKKELLVPKIESNWCNSNLGECAIKICIFNNLGSCDTQIGVHYNQIAPQLCNICGKTCVSIVIGGQEEKRFPCSTNLDCLFGQKCREGGCINNRQFKNCTVDSECDRLYSCQDAECKLKKLFRDSTMKPYKQGKTCQLTSDCDPGYKCKGFECVLIQ